MKAEPAFQHDHEWITFRIARIVLICVAFGCGMESPDHVAESDAVQMKWHQRPIHFSSVQQKRAISMMSEYLSRSFNVELDEVAFMVLDRQGNRLSFFAPDYLAEMNASFPYDRLQSVAARSLSDRKVRIDNCFYAVNHLSYFEKVKRSGRGSAPTSDSINFDRYPS